MLHIVLVEPEIPQNTGNIARTCACSGAALHLVGKLGFDIGEKAVRRAGLDYWDKLNIFYYENLDEFMKKHEGKTKFFCSTKAKKLYTEVDYTDGRTSQSGNANQSYAANHQSGEMNQKCNGIDYQTIEMNQSKDIYLLFGKETKGLPEPLIYDNYDYAIKIPMSEGIRSLNLSNAVAIILYEALRQTGFSGLN